MLKLKQVELQGFKSFCDRTAMRFHGEGIAAVVGPNGCGKSNLSDAISWVLGEQSAKSLRGTRMEDVIFAGTRERKPLGMAEVSLTLVDPALHAEHTGSGNGAHPDQKSHDITITRRLFRSGESEYLIDGRLARLRDIQDLFIGTGLGPESYAIIEQGRIGQILSSRPQDRRAVIEEAAGVGKFKTRRRLAEARLEGARQNLSRVFDILEEVGRQAASLKRQASKARRYQELHQEMMVQLRRSLAGRGRLLEREAAKTALDLNLANAGFQRLSGEVSSREREHDELQQACYRAEADLTGLRGRLGEQRVDAERTRGRLEAQAAQIATIEKRLAQAESESQDLEERAASLLAEWNTHALSLDELDRVAGQARDRLAAKTAERDSTQTALAEREHFVESARQQLLRLLEEGSALTNQLGQLDTYLEALARDRARCEKEESEAAADRDGLESRRGELASVQAARQGELESVAGRRRQAEEDLNSRKANIAQARSQLEQLRSGASALKARKDSLQEILSHRAYTTDSVKRLFTAIEQGQAEDLRPLGVLADFIEVDPAYEKAAEEFLHEELEYVVVDAWSQAERGIGLLRSDLDGRATFLVHPRTQPDASHASASEPALGPATGIQARLANLLRFTNGLAEMSARFLPRLARCFLVEDRGAAQRLAGLYPDLFFLLPDGVCYQGCAVSGGKKTGGGPLGLKRELRELTGLVHVRQRELEETASRLESLEREMAVLEQELDQLRALQQDHEKEVLALEHENRKLAEESSRAAARLSLARQELTRLEEEHRRAGAEREANLRGVEEKERERVGIEQGLAGRRVEIAALQASLGRLNEEHSALRVELAGQEERRRSEEAAGARLETARQELEARRGELAQEMERLGVERAHLLADNLDLDTRAAGLAGEIARSEERVRSLETEETRQREALAGIEESLRQLRVDLQGAQEERTRVEVLLAERRAALKYLEETCRKDLNISLDELAGADQVVVDEFGLAEAEENYNSLRARIDALGPVNPQALEEYQEAQQRYDFLNTQRQDLLDSIRDTETAIQEIDRESRRRFTDAYEAINAHFREVFQSLFGGGTGEMRMTDETNLAESGIEIVASPPGKRLQSVLLLSGGEKALTALALLMAIFRYQPSPFCILDEVDAPLDEPNIGRLMRLLAQMSHQTQFIIVTHARQTMEVAQALYGVTMQEPGVSKLVSVRFEQKAPAPAPPALSATAVEATVS